MDKVHFHSLSFKKPTTIFPRPCPDAPFAVFYRLHYGFVCRSLRKLRVSEAYVEDVAQEVFATALRRGFPPSEAEHARSWLWAIALRKASNHRVLRRHFVEAPFFDFHDPGWDPRLLERMEAAAWIRRVITRLTEKLRAVVVRILWEGRSIREIAAELGIGVKAAEWRWSRARARMLGYRGDFSQTTKPASGCASGAKSPNTKHALLFAHPSCLSRALRHMHERKSHKSEERFSGLAPHRASG